MVREVRMKRVAVIADLHCGHPAGLTPPAWQFRLGSIPERDLLSEYQAASWKRYEKAVKKAGDVDALFVLGDCIDGRETGRHLVSEDREDQCELAKECIRLWKAPRTVMVYGTRRHTGDLERWESQIAKDLKADIGSREFVQIEGVTFKLRHKMGRSSIPHGRGTPLAKAAVWNELRAARGKDVAAQVQLFAHGHYYWYTGGAQWVAMMVPGLQGASEYGAEEVDDDVDFGVVWFDVDGTSYDWHAEIAKVESGVEVIQI
jgi:hypothetical protein